MLSSKNKRTLEAIFLKPTKSDLTWREVERLLIALGATLKEGSGSRIRIELNGIFLTFHKPHPRPTLIKPAVETFRKYLKQAGVEP